MTSQNQGDQYESDEDEVRDKRQELSTLVEQSLPLFDHEVEVHVEEQLVGDEAADFI